MAEPLGGIVWRVALRVSPREDQSLRGTMQSRLCGMLALRMSRRVLGRRESVVDIFIDVGLRRTLGRGSPGRLLVPTDASNQMGGGGASPDHCDRLGALVPHMCCGEDCTHLLVCAPVLSCLRIARLRPPGNVLVPVLQGGSGYCARYRASGLNADVRAPVICSPGVEWRLYIGL